MKTISVLGSLARVCETIGRADGEAAYLSRAVHWRNQEWGGGLDG